MDRLVFAIWTAAMFLGFGTSFLIAQLCFENNFAITIFGYYYVLFSILCNSVIVLVLSIVLIFKSNRIKTLKSIGVLLINIPIAYIYFLIVINTFH